MKLIPINILSAVIFPFVFSACVSQSSVDFNKQQAAKARVELALGYLQQEDFVQAKLNLDKAFEHDDRYYLVHSALAHFYQLQGDTEKAKQAYLQAIKLDDKQGDVYKRQGLSKRRVTLSTSGVVPALDMLRDKIDVALAISLHAPNDELRDEIMPINKKYNIKMLMDSVHRYLEVSNANHGKVTIEYVLLDHVNDGTEHAHQLAQVLKNTPCKINLIPWNPFPEAPYGKSSNSRVDRFQKTLMEYGFTVIVRKTRGDDIDAACGQLAGDVIDRTKRTAMKRKFGEGIDVKAVN